MTMCQQKNSKKLIDIDKMCASFNKQDKITF